MFSGSQTFNNLSLLNANSFNRMFADTPTPADPVIDLSSGGEAEEYDSHNQGSRKRHHSSADVANIVKRKAHENFLTESQKTRNRNMPLKKRGTGNREEELSFLNLLDNENSNQAQNLVKIERGNDSSTCDSSSSVHPKRFLNLEPSQDIVCDCFNCFPVLGSKGAPKCKKVRQVEEAGSSSSSSEVIDATMIPGPSGLQSKKSILIPVKKRNYYESDSDDSDDQIELPDSQAVPILIDDGPIDVKSAALTAPDLQLDWLSDSSPEDDDDVIFVSDRTAPIDLTADSDTDNSPSPIDAVSMERSQNGNASDYSTQSVRNSPALEPTAAPSLYRPYHCIDFAPTPLHRVYPTTVNTQRTPIMSSVASTSVPTPSAITLASPPRVIINIPTPPLHTPAPRQTNFRNMITGNDVMLYDGQNYVPRFMRESPSNPPNPEAAVNDNANHATAPRQRVQNQSPGPNHHQRRNYNLPSTTNYYRPPSPVFRRQSVPPDAPENPVVPPTAHQNCRQHVGRCPFMTEGHHYNRPRRFTRDFYSMSSGRPPYAVHEDLWRRQYQEQEIRRHYWSPSFNENASEVQVLRPPPATPYFGTEPAGHRLVASLSDNNNNHNNVTNSTDSLRNLDRLRNLQQPNAHTRHRRVAPWWVENFVFKILLFFIHDFSQVQRNSGQFRPAAHSSSHALLNFASSAACSPFNWGELVHATEAERFNNLFFVFFFR